jgi:hypothetical protein
VRHERGAEFGRVSGEVVLIETFGTLRRRMERVPGQHMLLGVPGQLLRVRAQRPLPGRGEVPGGVRHAAPHLRGKFGPAIVGVGQSRADGHLVQQDVEELRIVCENGLAAIVSEEHAVVEHVTAGSRAMPDAHHKSAVRGG